MMPSRLIPLGRHFNDVGRYSSLLMDEVTEIGNFASRTINDRILIIHRFDSTYEAQFDSRVCRRSLHSNDSLEVVLNLIFDYIFRNDPEVYDEFRGSYHPWTPPNDHLDTPLGTFRIVRCGEDTREWSGALGVIKVVMMEHRWRGLASYLHLEGTPIAKSSAIIKHLRSNIVRLSSRDFKSAVHDILKWREDIIKAAEFVRSMCPVEQQGTTWADHLLGDWC